MYHQRRPAAAFVTATLAAMLPGLVAAEARDRGDEAHLDEIVVVAHKEQRSVTSCISRMRCRPTGT